MLALSFGLTHPQPMMDLPISQLTKPVRIARSAGLTRHDWVRAAKEAFISGGIAALGVRSLAASLGVTPGAFYWQFRNLEDLLDELRLDWEQSNSRPFSDAIQNAGPEGLQQYLAWVRVLIEEQAFRPEYDNAFRDWARVSPRTAEVLERTERARIEVLHQVFVALGFEGHSAEIRARVTYYHQVGYIAMRVRESAAERIRNIPFYAEVLTGQDARDAIARSAWVRAIQSSLTSS